MEITVLTEIDKIHKASLSLKPRYLALGNNADGRPGISELSDSPATHKMYQSRTQGFAWKKTKGILEMSL